MRALLMDPEQDFARTRALPPHADALVQDLALAPLLDAMAGEDALILEVARTALLTGIEHVADGAAGAALETIRYRQDALADALAHADVVRELYAITGDVLERRRRNWYFGLSARHPSSILHGALTMLEMSVGVLRRLRAVADRHAYTFVSPAFTQLFAMLQRELDEGYLATVREHLAMLRFRHGELLSARLGARNEGAGYVLRQPGAARMRWLDRVLGRGGPAFTFHIPEQDETGARALTALRDRGLNAVANAVAQSDEHVASFFEALRTELAFYVGALNLRDRLAALGGIGGTPALPIAFPEPAPSDSGALRARGLYDVSLALTLGAPVVGNDLAADGVRLVIITGANQGGKSSFLRSVGLAQLMLQAGLFVGADAFAAELCTGLFTHYTREEDAAMEQGRLDEELGRLSGIVDRITPGALLLLNESFAATNEREGSEIARQVVLALVEHGVRILFVTHLHAFARAVFDRRRGDALFLRAERRADGTRTFRLIPGAPLATSHGEDLYRAIFGERAGAT